MFICRACNFSETTNRRYKHCPNCGTFIGDRTTRIVDNGETYEEGGAGNGLSPLANHQSLVSKMDSLDLAQDLVNRMEQTYLARERLEKDNPFWNKFGKHLTAYKNKRNAVKILHEIDKAKTDFLLESHKQIMEAELRRQALILEDAIRNERFGRAKELARQDALIRAAASDEDGLAVVRFLAELGSVISSSALQFLPDEEKTDIVMGLYKARLNVAFNLPTAPQNPSLTDSGFNGIETDFDE